MKKVLITGFTPFGGEDINPAFEAIKRIKDIEDVELHKLEVETAFYDSFDIVKAKIDEIKPDFVLLVGQAGGRQFITIEKVAINYIFASIPDNNGKRITDKKILEQGPDAYFSTLNNRHIIDEVRRRSITLKESYTAGTYVCNYLMYTVLDYLKNTNTKSTFIHVPYIQEQVINNQVLLDRKTPYMTLFDITLGLTEIIRAL